MRYVIEESHRHWSAAKMEELRRFLVLSKNLDNNLSFEDVDYKTIYEKEHALKCFEAIAYDKSKIVGYMRCFKNPSKRERWFVGDIYVLSEYRKKHIASKLYKKVIEEVMTYENAEYIEASIADDNLASIKLHEKLGFKDTRKRGKFAGFSFATNETFYKKTLFSYLPVDAKMLLENEEIKNLISNIWTTNEDGPFSEYSFDELLDKSFSDELDINLIWLGSRIVGISVTGEGLEVTLVTVK